LVARLWVWRKHHLRVSWCMCRVSPVVPPLTPPLLFFVFSRSDRALGSCPDPHKGCLVSGFFFLFPTVFRLWPLFLWGLWNCCFDPPPPFYVSKCFLFFVQSFCKGFSFGVGTLRGTFFLTLFFFFFAPPSPFPLS